MKIRFIFGIAALAISLSSCADVPGTSNNPGSSGAEVPAPRINIAKVPTGHPHPEGKANMVVSPYRPYNVIDIKGYRSGDIVGDPSTGKAHPTTGVLIPGTAKCFRIP